MKKFLISLLTVFILFLLQSNIFQYISFNGIVPNFLLIVVCFYGYKRGENSGILAGFFCGLMYDLMFSEFLGFHSLILIFLGFFNAQVKLFYVEDNYRLPVVCIALSDLLYTFVTYGLRFLLNGKFDFSYYFTSIIVPEAIYTTILAILIFPLLVFVEDKVIPVKEKEEEDAV